MEQTSCNKYRNLIWSFEFRPRSQASGQPQERLRVYSSEEEMFERGSLKEAFPISLPWDSLDMCKVSRRECARSRMSSYDLREAGRLLWDAIPTAAKLPILEANVDQPCRLKISSNSPKIDDLPWEWLSNGSGPPFALQSEVRLARSVPQPLPTPPCTVTLPLRVLLVITNPKDEMLLDPHQEIPAVIQGLSPPNYEVRILEEPTLNALQEAVKRVQPHILHYIGHAGLSGGEGNIILHDYRNMTHWISGSELSKLMPLSMGLLCLSTCFTAPNYQILGLPRLALTAATYQLPTTVVNRYPVSQESVTIFWQRFYSVLMNENGNVNEAFHQAQAAVFSEPMSDADWGSFSLVIRNQSGEVFRLGEMPSKEKYAEEIQAKPCPEDGFISKKVSAV